MTGGERSWNGFSGARADLVCLPAALLFVALLVAHVVLVMFYARGAYGDTVHFSVMSWRSGWALRVPSFAGGMDTAFKGHLSWFFWLPSAVSFLLPLGRIPFFALFTGSLYALLGLAVWLALDEFWPARGVMPALTKSFAAMAFALNGAAQAPLVEAHLEIAGPAFALIFLWALVRRHHAVAVAAFILALSQREDMGFHIFALLFLLALVDRVRRVPAEHTKPALAYAGAALAYSVAALAIKHFLFHEWHVFSLIYAGQNPAASGGLDAGLLRGRLENLLLQRPWIWGPGLVALLWALACRNPYILIGWLAFVPWLALNLTARADIAGNLGLHYGYPFIIAGAWPLLAASRRFMDTRRVAPARPALAVPAAILLLAVQQPAQIYPDFEMKSHFLPMAAAPVSEAAYDEFERHLPRLLAVLPRTRVDEGVFSIAPYALDENINLVRNRLIRKNGTKFEATAPPERGLDAVIYFKNGWDREYIKGLIAANEFHLHYYVPRTNIYLSSAREISGVPELANVFFPAPLLPPEAQTAR